MWKDEQPRKDSNGKRWNFRIWHDVWSENKVLMAQRVFFWDDSKSHCGVGAVCTWIGLALFPAKQTIGKLVADPALREQYRKDLRFPLERYYSDFGAFPEEKPN